ncbi:uncharacterized protein LOC120837834 [Ixodes scapularis]|uniref:uncharacterized protein LOC120837834 n=1 Tax=Ixodes scapularis TaxID=6945 RepID=UPI001A9DF13B|nr:uncharacterized protein LOC120837834 [Ixodes scapularis]
MGTHNCLWLLRRVINRRSRKALPDYILALDMRKAFDNVSQEAILQELAQRYPSQRAQDWIRSFLQQRPIQLNGKASGWTPKTYFLDRGVPQGSILGPLLFNLAMTRVAQRLERDTVARFTIYADDVTIWTEAADYPDSQTMQIELQAAVLSVSQTLEELGLELSPEKTELLSVDGKHVTNPAHQITLHVGSQDIQSSNGQTRILGIQIASCNSPKAWTKHLRKHWSPLLHTIRRVSNKYGGARQQSCQTLARATAVGRILYGTPAYDCTPTLLRDIERLHRATLRTIAGLPKHVRNDRLLATVPIPPIDVIMAEARSQFTSRLENTLQGRSTLAWDLQRHVAWSGPDEASPWDSPVISLKPIKAIPTQNSDLRNRMAYQHHNAENNGHIHIYTDASFLADRAGLAWHCTSRPELTGAHTCTLPQGTALQAELLAIWGGTCSIPNLPDLQREQTLTRTYRIYTDSVAALEELSTPTTEDATAVEIRKRLRMLQDLGADVQILWTPAHTGVPGGNAAAHAAATQARGSNVTTTPPSSQIPFANPYLTLMTPRSFLHYLRTRIRKDSKDRLQRATPETLFSPTDKYTRAQEVFLNKIMTNAAYTPHIIQKWLPIDLNIPLSCPHCQKTAKADLLHLIWDCSAFTTGRDTIVHIPHSDHATLVQHLFDQPANRHLLATFGSVSGLTRMV